MSDSRKHSDEASRAGGSRDSTSDDQLKEKIYVFKVSMEGKDNVYRDVAVKGSFNLRNFAREITGAFDFEFDQPFGFYSNVKDIYKSDEAYTAFKDDGVPRPHNEKSARSSCIYKVFKPSKKMLFLFDYSDEWRFIVECRFITEAKDGVTYPKVLRKIGTPPKQYAKPDEEESGYED